MTQIKYDEDLCLWLKKQADFILNKQFNKLDIENLADEVSSIVSKEKEGLYKNIKILILDRLRAINNTRPQGCIYEDSLAYANFMAYHALKDSPSLKEYLPDALHYTYATARLQFLDENDMDFTELSEECPWKIEEIIDGSLYRD